MASHIAAVVCYFTLMVSMAVAVPNEYVWVLWPVTAIAFMLDAIVLALLKVAERK